MAQQNDIDIRIAAQTDQSSFAKAEKSINKLSDVSRDSVKEISSGEKQSKLLSAAYKQLAKDAENYNDELRQLVDNQKEIANAPRPASASSDAGSNAPLKGAARGIVGGNPILDAADSLADLQEAASSTIGALGGGTQGLLAFGAAGIALGATLAIGAVLLDDYNRKAKEQADAINAIINAQRELNTEIAQGLTSDTAREKLSQVNTEYQLQAQLLAELQESYRQFEEQSGVLGGAIKLVSEQEEALYTQLEQQEALVAELAETQEGYTEALEDGSLASNDAKQAAEEAAEAERTLAAERSAGVLASAAAAASIAQAEIQTRDQTVEGVQRLIQSEQDRLTLLNTEIAALKASGDSSEAVTAKLAQLASQASTAKARLDVFNKSLGDTGRQTDAEKKASSDISKAVSSGSGGSSGSRFFYSSAKNVSKATSQIGNSFQDLQKKEIEFANSLIKLRNSLGENIDKINLGLSRSLEDAAIDTRRSITDALSEGAFLSIRSVQRDAKREREDLEREANRDRIDAQRSAAMEILKIEQDLARQRIQIAASGTSGKPSMTKSLSNVAGSFVSVTPR